ncbi:hypothetical protein [Taibaiella koreensis]|uniref:hypothetical protein n=1 Tax=Taibaiella koreensis TaxID=1268548 RepID=UPI000E59CFE3|nr:hypothetical protein [Taibaiella koreensis]
MIDLMALRPGNYIHAGQAGNHAEPDSSRYLRVLSVQLMEKRLTAKADEDVEIYTLGAGDIYPCPLDRLMQMIGGLAFGEHSILIQGPGAVAIVHENGSLIPLPHIRYLHEFQNLFRSLTGQEFPYNVG